MAEGRVRSGSKPVEVYELPLQSQATHYGTSGVKSYKVKKYVGLLWTSIGAAYTSLVADRIDTRQ